MCLMVTTKFTFAVPYMHKAHVVDDNHLTRDSTSVPMKIYHALYTIF